ncbi:FmdE family protein [Desulfovibrio sp.]
MMYAPGIDQELIDKVVAFHGHWCASVSSGIRVALWVRENMGSAEDGLLAISEGETCAVDAIQVLLGCTLGKGNLLCRDVGKTAFIFVRRSDGKKVRIVEKVRDDETTRRMAVIKKELTAQNLSEWIRTKLEIEMVRLRRKEMDHILSAPFEDLFRMSEPEGELPQPVRRLPVLVCPACGEEVLMARAVDMDGRRLCADCARRS